MNNCLKCSIKRFHFIEHYIIFNSKFNLNNFPSKFALEHYFGKE